MPRLQETDDRCQSRAQIKLMRSHYVSATERREALSRSSQAHGWLDRDGRSIKRNRTQTKDTADRLPQRAASSLKKQQEIVNPDHLLLPVSTRDSSHGWKENDVAGDARTLNAVIELRKRGVQVGSQVLRNYRSQETDDDGADGIDYDN
ncbi:hypothetical protein NQZ68_018513 [Dissostichus eleginoides]|nr:hypothetical protein NQZ68_018513 [Dissostichus eleginoides]